MHAVLLTVVILNVGCLANLTVLPTTDDILKFITAEDTSKQKWTPKISTTTLLIKKAGFQPEVHKVVTEDGYILQLTRIRNGELLGPPVLIVHGLLEASDTFLQRGRNNDLAFTLSDGGFDVWLADLRGNIFSRNHQSLKIYQPKFWDFSFHEMAIYDMPAFIAEIQNNSLYHKIYYIGHSMGTSIFSVLTSTKPEFNKLIQMAVLLSPIHFAVKGEIKSKIVRELFRESDHYSNILKKAGVYNLLPRNNITGALLRVSCVKPIQEICLNVIGDLFGENRKNLNKTKIGDYFTTLLSGTSVKTVMHLTQLYRTDEFKQFDHGKLKNLQVYGQQTPPQYNLKQITVPTAIFYSHNDYFLDERSVQKYANSIKNVVYIEALPKYSHMDYLFGNDAPKILHRKIVNIFNGKIPKTF